MHCLRLNSLNSTLDFGTAENDARIHNEKVKILPELILLWIHTHCLRLFANSALLKSKLGILSLPFLQMGKGKNGVLNCPNL